MAPNSSPFKPTINKLSSQYLIQDHMSSHYMKLGTVKSAIDSKPPKSMMSSVKKRDQMRREAMAKQMKLFDFEKGMKHGSGANSRHSIDGAYGSQRMLSATVTKTGHDEPRPQSVSSYYSERSSRRSYTSPGRPRSASSTPYFGASNSKSPRDRTQIRKPDVLTETYSGDYLDRHEDRFKNADTPFTPRLKKRPGKSHLSQSKHYAPPLVVHKETKRKVSPRKNHEDISPSSSTSSLDKEDKSEKKVKEDKHMMEERTRSLSRLSLDSRKTYDNIYPERNSYDGYGFRSGEGNDTFFGTSRFSGRISRNETFSSYTKSRIEAEEEEMKYLEFINSVTNDILTRGVYSDRVLTQVMERHLIQNKRKLDEGRMRHMLMKLQQDLGVSASPLTDNFEDSKDHSMRYEHSVFSDRDHHSSELKERSYSSIASSASSHEHPVVYRQEKMTYGDQGIPKPKKRGILKTGGASSGFGIDRRSALSSGDEKENDTKAENQLNLALDQPDPLLATMKMNVRSGEDSKKIYPGHATLSGRSSSIDKDLNDALSIKSNSAHSLGSLHSGGTSSHGSDL